MIFLRFLTHLCWCGIQKLKFATAVLFGIPLLFLYLVLLHWWTKPLSTYYLKWEKEVYPPGAFREKFGVEPPPPGRFKRLIKELSEIDFT